MPLNVAHFPCGYGSRLSVSLLWSLGRWQTLVKCPNPCAGDTVGPLAIPNGQFSALGLEPSLQGLVRIGMCLLAYWVLAGMDLNTRLVQRLLRKPVCSGTATAAVVAIFVNRGSAG